MGLIQEWHLGMRLDLLMLVVLVLDLLLRMPLHLGHYALYNMLLL